MTKIKDIGNFLLIILLGFVLLTSIRGFQGNPDASELISANWRENGPFELSPERGRFALTFSLVESMSVHFPLDIAKFVVPDLGYTNGNYVSLFAPLLSFIVLPGYLIGKYFGISQVGTFSIITLAAIVNFLLIYRISHSLKANRVSGLIAGIMFLFATPAYSYAVNLYQHHITTLLILISLMLYINYKGFWSAFWIFLMYALGLTLDYPNLFLLFPITLAAGLKVFEVNTNKNTFRLKIKLIQTFSILGVALPLLFFFWFNNASYGNPFTMLGGSQITSVKDIDTAGNPININKINIQDTSSTENLITTATARSSYFEPRKLVNGLYILIFSQDRGVVTFTPIILFGVLGCYYLSQSKHKTILSLFTAIIAINIVLYSMWGDPWGGWAFGSRYMIPGYAILSILASIALTRLNKKWYFVIPFWIILTYSIFVNTLGALTTSAMPPKVEAEALSQISGKQEKYSWDRNWDFINSGKSKSFVYQTWGHNYVNSVQYFYIIFGTITGLSTILMIANIYTKREEKK